MSNWIYLITLTRQIKNNLLHRAPLSKRKVLESFQNRQPKSCVELYLRNYTFLNMLSKAYSKFEMFCSLLDDVEMYEQQKPFTLNDYISMSRFLNRFLFTFIMTGHYGELSARLIRMSSTLVKQFISWAYHSKVQHWVKDLSCSWAQIKTACHT